MKRAKKNNQIVNRRKARVRAKISGTAKRPRLSIFRSNTSLYAQLIDDEKGVTLVSASTRSMKKDKGVVQARELGKMMGKKAKEAKISAIVLDRSAYAYHGRIKAFAEGAREEGLTF